MRDIKSSSYPILSPLPNPLPVGEGVNGTAMMLYRRQYQKRIRLEWVIVLLALAPQIAGTQEESMSRPDQRTAEAIALMEDFAQRTGLDSDRPPVRYLWTDAFAVCNLLGLARTTGEEHYTELALQLVDQVHHTLGRHRPDDPRSGWLSGLPERAGAAHPTRGGLRIGKGLPERGADEPIDTQQEWDRDGQYFHYLTKWMHALDQVSRATGEPRFNAWARELAQTAHTAFTYQPATEPTPQMVWKMSIDLTRPLVPSMGQHDPLDGYITALQLRATAAGLPQPVNGPDLEEATRRFAAMTESGTWASPDPLGIGGLLTDAWRVAQLQQQSDVADEQLLERLLSAARTGLEHYARSGELQAPAGYRLAFRELGLAIGLHAAERLQQAVAESRIPANPEARAALAVVLRYVPMGAEIESFWQDPAHQRADSWSEHRNINAVMLATSLAPDGFLVLEAN